MIFSLRLNPLAPRRVRMLRRWIEGNRCTVRPGLTHVWKEIYACVDASQACPPAEYVGDRCMKCEIEELL